MTETFVLHPQLADDSFVIGNLELCRVLLINDSQFPWFALVPQRSDISEIYQLSLKDQELLWWESRTISEQIMTLFNGDKLNLAAIGNMVPQLHVHHIVRFKQDACWPAPIWGKLPMIEYSLTEVRKIQQKLTKLIPAMTPATI